MAEKDVAKLQPKDQAAMSTSPSSDSEIVKALANLQIADNFRDEVINYITKPYDVKTPSEKVKKRPDGYDYVESSYMDHSFKNFSPLYEHQLLHCMIHEGEVGIIVSSRDRTTGNVELGGDGAKINLGLGNALKSAISKAIKNAQSRFGISADVYRKRESIPNDEERTRYEAMLKEITSISPTRAQIFKDQWASLGTDWSEFLDNWQVYIDRNVKKPS